MSRSFPLSVAEYAVVAQPALDVLPDGIVDVKPRDVTRLWYRGAGAPSVVRPTVVSAAIKSAENPQTDRPVAERLRQAAEPTPTSVPAAALPWAPVDPAPAAASPLTEWRMVPAGAPVLLLSAGPVLGGKPGPILGPGMRYRIATMTGSVVGVEVMHANGDTRGGFANAVDLHHIEPKIRTGELQPPTTLTGRLKLTKLASTTFGLFGV